MASEKTYVNDPRKLVSVRISIYNVIMDMFPEKTGFNNKLTKLLATINIREILEK